MKFIEVSNVKEFLKLDDTDEPGLLDLFIKNAEAYIINALDIPIDPLNENMIAQAQLIGLVLISDYNENRTFIVQGRTNEPSEKVRTIVQGMLNQLKYSYSGGAI